MRELTFSVSTSHTVTTQNTWVGSKTYTRLKKLLASTLVLCLILRVTKFGLLFKKKVRSTFKLATRFAFQWILQLKVLMTRLLLPTQAYTMILMLVAMFFLMMV